MVIFSFCGLNCTTCSAYIAKRTNDQELRIKTAEKWSFLLKLKPEEINCDGCPELDGVLIPFCKKDCKVRECVISRNIDSCAYCVDYPCHLLEDLWEWLRIESFARKNLNWIRENSKSLKKL
ncbi:MAG: DUF3795 domain-containing protein [Candidatus Heimdallarchaeota archaeon]|nr:DUF3795 domain-containing protein [Candidatus Heimdallarchaeota archaeon]